MYVSLLDQDKQSLGLIHPALCRLLLKEKKAKPVPKLCIPHKVFVIRLLSNDFLPSTIYTPELTLGVDPGSGKAGFAVSTNSGKVVYASCVEVRNDVTGKMKRRASYRRTRRNRKTRYRKPRFLNRYNSKKENRLPPTLISKIWSHKREIQYILSSFNINRIVLEKAKFDISSISSNRKLKSWEYQKGNMYGYETIKEYIKDIDNYQCQVCKKKGYGKNGTKLEVHHILERSNGGTNTPSNLITLCSECHKKVHLGKVQLKKKRLSSITKHATQTDIIVSQLREWFNSDKMFDYIPRTYIFGIKTKLIRNTLNLPRKSKCSETAKHICDAVSISLVKNKKVKVKKECKVVYKKCISKGDYQLYKGIRSEKKIQVGKVLGFRKFDKVLFKSKECFVKGKRSSGYFELMDVKGNKLDFKPLPKIKDLIRLEARRSWLVA